jgi:hypothetical protein
MTKFIFTLLTFAMVTCLQAQAPTITSFFPSSGSIGSLVTIIGTNLNNPTALTIGGVSALPISNTGTSLVVMVMPGTVDGKIRITTANGSDSSNSNFTVVASLTPNAQQGNKLVGTGNSGASEQGFSVCISADGNTAIVGGRQDNGGKGAAWIYTRTGGVWSQQGSKLTGSGGSALAQQGCSVGLSADGNTAIVGGFADNNHQGAAWVYTRVGGVWSQQGNKLLGIGNAGQARQGIAVCLSGDGNTAMVGGYSDNNYEGAVWVYTREGGVWSQQGNKLIGLGNIGSAWQGNAVSLSADGNTALIGGYGDDDSQGAIWVYTRAGGIWSQQGNKLVGSNHIGAAVQGISVSISADGNTAIAGGYGDNGNRGAAWIYTRANNVWTQQGNKLVGLGDVGLGLQGVSVSLSADGNKAIVGGYRDDGGRGAIWVYQRTGNSWTQQGSKLTGIGSTSGGGWQGYSVGLSANGSTAVVGGYIDNGSLGAAWIFTNSSSLPTTITSLQAFQKNTSIQVEWNTKNETNLSSYEVEKSSNGSSFSKAGTVIAKGLSSYNWFDASPTNGSNYYRLKMMDKDGSFKYSSIVNVKVGGSKNVFTIAGNPSKNNSLVLQMENVDKGSYALSIYNNAGQLMMNRTIVHEGGSATQTVHLSNVSAGTYQLSIVGKSIKITKTVLVK